MTEYTDASIKEFENLAHVRHRPTTYVGDVGTYGQFHAIKEVIDNSNDETELRPGGQITVWFFQAGPIYQVVVQDNGRGVPLGAFVNCFTKLGTSGKHNTEAYRTSAGLLGMGGKAAAGLANAFRALTMRDGQIGTLQIVRGEIKHSGCVTYHSPTTGTQVAWEPDSTIFDAGDIGLFAQQRYQQIIDLLQLLSVFAYNTRYVFNLVNKPLDAKFWTLPAEQAVWFIEQTYNSDNVVVFDSAAQTTQLDYLRNLWNVQSQFVWTLDGIIKPLPPRETGDKLGYDLRLFLAKQMQSGALLTMVNNVPMRDTSSSHIVAILSCLKHRLHPFFENEDFKKYFLDIYKLPIYVAASIKYEGAQFHGATKDGFKDKIFLNQFEKELTQHFLSISEEVWKQLYDLLIEDVELKYNLFYNKQTTKKKRESSQFIDAQYWAAPSMSRENSELYIVEGRSAAHCIDVRLRTHGVLIIQGKPKNVIGKADDHSGSLDHLTKFKPYRELQKILQVTPQQTDLSGMAYQKIIILSDADQDGIHIRNLHLGAIYSINRRIIEEGRVFIANPPLFEVSVKGSAKKLFLQDAAALEHCKIDHLYRKALDIAIQSDGAFPTPTSLTGAAFKDFCLIVLHVGDLMTKLSGRLAIPEEIIEKLAMISYAIEIGKVDVAVLKRTFGPRMAYNPQFHMLSIPFMDKNGSFVDIHFSLHGVREALYEEVLPVLNNICWKRFKIFVTTRYSDFYKQTPISIIELYRLFDTLNGMFKIERRKGLGGMRAEDLFTTCMDPHTRVLTRITSVGDVGQVYDMLGDEVGARRHMLVEAGILK